MKGDSAVRNGKFLALSLTDLKTTVFSVRHTWYDGNVRCGGPNVAMYRTEQDADSMMEEIIAMSRAPGA